MRYPRSTLGGLLAVARAPFLPLAILLALSGTLSQRADPDLLPALLAIVCLTAAHIVVNVLNELADNASGLDAATQRTPFSGGSGALQDGRVSVAAAVVLACCAGVTAAASAIIALIGLNEWRLLPVLLGGAVCVFFYSPWLLRLGLGEFAAGLGLGGLPIIAAAMMQGGPLAPAVYWVAAAATALTFNLLLLNAIPDCEPDARHGRRTLVLLLGVRRTARLALLVALLPAVLLGLGWRMAALPAGVFMVLLPTVFCAVGLLSWLRSGAQQPMPPRLLAVNVLQNLGTHSLLILTFVFA